MTNHELARSFVLMLAACTGAPHSASTTQALTTHPGMSALWVASPSDVWVGGYRGALLRGNEEAGFVPFPSGTDESIYRFWGSSPNDVWLTSRNGADVTYHHFDGTEWTPSLTRTLEPLKCGAHAADRGLGGSGPSDVWGIDARGTIVHFDGTAWTQIDSAVPPDLIGWCGLDGVSGTSVNDLWGITEDPDPSKEQQLIVHWDGTGWNLVYRYQAGDGCRLSTTGTGSANDLWVTESCVQHGGALRHFDGTTWTITQTGTPGALWVAAPADVWLGSDYFTGTLHWDGKTYASHDTGFLDIVDTMSRFGGAGVHAWALAWSGTIIRWDGTAWNAVP